MADVQCDHNFNLQCNWELCAGCCRSHPEKCAVSNHNKGKTAVRGPRKPQVARPSAPAALALARGSRCEHTRNRKCSWDCCASCCRKISGRCAVSNHNTGKVGGQGPAARSRWHGIRTRNTTRRPTPTTVAAGMGTASLSALHLDWTSHIVVASWYLHVVVIVCSARDAVGMISSKQCSSMTTRGRQCRNWTTNPSGLCYCHDDEIDCDDSPEDEPEEHKEVTSSHGKRNTSLPKNVKALILSSPGKGQVGGRARWATHTHKLRCIAD